MDTCAFRHLSAVSILSNISVIESPSPSLLLLSVIPTSPAPTTDWGDSGGVDTGYAWSALRFTPSELPLRWLSSSLGPPSTSTCDWVSIIWVLFRWKFVELDGRLR